MGRAMMRRVHIPLLGLAVAAAASSSLRGTHGSAKADSLSSLKDPNSHADQPQPHPGQPQHHSPSKPECFSSAGSLKWTSRNGGIYVNDRRFHLKGVNWFGFETETYALHGLDQRTMDEYFEFLRENNFNALRLPFSLAFVKTYDEPTTTMQFRDPELNGMTKRQLLNHVISKAADNRMLVMLDMHRLNDQFIPQLWYSENDPAQEMVQGWDTILGDVKAHWNVFAVDLKNEPYGVASWGTGQIETDWNKAAEGLAQHILTTHTDFQGLVFVEGTIYSSNFQGLKTERLDFGKPEYNDRMVFSPHQYGPSVVMLKGFTDNKYPNNLPESWMDNWGFARDLTGRAVILGEWGGRYVGLDKLWGDRFARFLQDNCFNDQFFWCMNPDSGDTYGLLQQDWRTPETAKLQLIDSVQPHPSFLYKDDASDGICLEPGSFAANKCSARRIPAAVN